MKIFNELKWFLKEHWKTYLIGSSALITIALLNLLPPLITGRVIDNMTNQSMTIEKVMIFTAIIIGSGIFMYFLRFVWRYMIFGVSVRLENNVRESLFKHFTEMDNTFYHENRVGDLMAHATNDVKQIQRVAGMGFLQFVDAVSNATIIIIALIVTLNFRVTLISLIPSIGIIIFAQWIGKKLHACFKSSQEAFSFMNDRAHENIAGIKVTKAFHKEDKQIEQFKQQADLFYKRNMKLAKYDGLFDPVIGLAAYIQMALAIILGVQMVIANEATIGQVFQFVHYLMALIWPLMAFGFLYNNIQRGSASYDRINELLAKKSLIQDIEGAMNAPENGDFNINIHSFKYPTSETLVLKNIQFDVKHGQTIGIVGKTGSGKTSLLRLIMREYDVSDGTVMYQHQDVKNYKHRSYLTQMSYVPQEQFLFSMTIEDNIKFAVKDATLEQVREVASKSAIDQDIMDFPEGYQTLVGERGVSLSGGQKQRISIARALLVPSSVMILDDSLSAVDAKTEEAIVEALKTDYKKQTTFIVAHRMSAVKHADLILVLDEGEIIERGNHETLMANGGWYAKITNDQALKGDDFND